MLREFKRSILSGKGLIEGTLGAVAGAVGVEETFDYVVIGGGMKGNAICVRLAEASFFVAILEAEAVSYVSPFSTWFEKAFLASGMNKTKDFNNGHLLGTHYVQMKIRASDQTRSSSTAYIGETFDNKNLRVYIITFMWNYTMFGLAYEVKMDSLDRVLHDPLVLAKALTDDTTKAEGVLTSNVAEFIGWERLPDKYRANLSESTVEALKTFPDDWPEAEMSLISGNGYVGTFSLPVLQQPLSGKQYATTLGDITASLSRGNVSIYSSSTSDLPLINTAWLSRPADQQLAIGPVPADA
ncbi:hypothetical protein B0J12DRAFT_761354 [Macrophomina phaseolina]|uniref:Uncharacterized protein n=1 Tax=Macrophomina phaseolina TaxID=35725 RepID=A0ABQ8G2J0_9PEZI|nr:hypothetical protein B0J12DRAFT_761354 [Macrophomina phaseolina]